MTDTQDWNEAAYEGSEEQLGGNDLVKTLRKQLKEKSQAEKELADKYAALQGKHRETQLSSVLSSKGVPSKVAALIPGDIEPDEESVDKWLGEFGDVFNIQREGESNGTEPVDVETATQIQKMQDVSHGAESAGGTGRVTEADFMNATSLDDVRALIARGS